MATGKTIRRSSSTRSARSSACTSWQLPATRTGPVDVAVSSFTAPTRSSPSTWEFSHSSVVSVRVATCLGIVFIFTAISPS